MTETGFHEQVADIVRRIPPGQVLTYGQVAALIGLPRAAQAVGWSLHWHGDKLPWQRVVNRNGRLAPGVEGGMLLHAEILGHEGVEVRDDFTIDLAHYQWRPPAKLIEKLTLPPESLEKLAQLIPLSVRH